jgi:hypothetical protein
MKSSATQKNKMISYKQALAEVFPNNLSTHCAIHIQRNVWTKFGIKASTNVARAAETFSARIKEELLKEIGNVSQSARIYVENIEMHRWWSSKWVDDRVSNTNGNGSWMIVRPQHRFDGLLIIMFGFSIS